MYFIFHPQFKYICFIYSYSFDPIFNPKLKGFRLIAYFPFIGWLLSERFHQAKIPGWKEPRSAKRVKNMKFTNLRGKISVDSSSASLCSWRFCSRGVKSLGGEWRRSRERNGAEAPSLLTPRKQNRQLLRLFLGINPL